MHPVICDPSARSSAERKETLVLFSCIYLSITSHFRVILVQTNRNAIEKTGETKRRSNRGEKDRCAPGNIAGNRDETAYFEASESRIE